MEPLRHVRFDGYTLQTWDTHRVDKWGKSVLRYEMREPGGTLLFNGEDFHCSPIISIDSDDCLRSILGFLTLRPGDTNDEYFKDYTEEQMEFAKGDAEHLQLWAMDDGDDEYPAPEFEEI